MPHDGHLLASFKIIPPKVRVSRQKCHFLIILILHGWMRTRIFENNLRHNFCFFFFGCFCRKFCHADLDSREQQAILLKKVEYFRPKLRFFCFSGEIISNICHMILSRRSRFSRTTSGPTRLIRPRPIDCEILRYPNRRRWRLSRFWPSIFFDEHIDI